MAVKYLPFKPSFQPGQSTTVMSRHIIVPNLSFFVEVDALSIGVI